MPVPKRKVSKSKVRMRKASKRWKKPNLFVDPKTGNRHHGHCVDPETGMYRGRQVLSQEVGEDG
ncbi:MAG: 50S ribosomal protein L32 [Verrucomicrobiota bacterium]